MPKIHGRDISHLDGVVGVPTLTIPANRDAS
jgi:hypothetical protein